MNFFFAQFIHLAPIQLNPIFLSHNYHIRHYNELTTATSFSSYHDCCFVDFFRNHACMPAWLKKRMQKRQSNVVTDGYSISNIYSAIGHLKHICGYSLLVDLHSASLSKFMAWTTKSAVTSYVLFQLLA